MFAGADTHIINELDRLLAESQPLAEISADVIRLIAPDDGSGHWPHVLVLLHLLESPRVFSALRREDFPGDLAETLESGLKTAGVSLGFRPVGPLHIQTQQLRQRFDSERRKYEIVSGRLTAGVDESEAVRMLGAYLDTGSGPVFVEAFRNRYSMLMLAAEALRQKQLDHLLMDEKLVGLLRFEQAQVASDLASELGERFSKLLLNEKNQAMILARALREDNTDMQLVAAGLAGYLRLADLVPNLLELLVAGSPIAPQVAVIAAHLSPEMTRQMLSDLLVDMMYGNPEDPDMVLTPARETTIVTARCLLPRIGSPLPAVEAGEIGASVLPEKVERIWQTWSLML